MLDQRRLRFSDITGIERRDLPMAAEIWLDELFRATWINRESMKLAAYFVRYMSRPDANALTLREIENQCQLNTDEVRKSLVLMRTFGAIEAFLIDRNDIRVGLRLSLLQRLRTLEARSRMLELSGRPAGSSWTWFKEETKWVPTPAAAAAPVNEDGPRLSRQPAA